MLRPPSNPRLPRRCRSSGRTGESPRTPEPVRAHRAAAHRVVTRIERANQAACGAAEVLRLPKVEEPVREAVSGPGEPRIAAQVRIGDHPAVEELAGHRLAPPFIGVPFLAFPAGMIRSRVLILAISLVVAAIVGFALLLFRRRPPPSA